MTIAIDPTIQARQINIADKIYRIQGRVQRAPTNGNGYFAIWKSPYLL